MTSFSLFHYHTLLKAPPPPKKTKKMLTGISTDTTKIFRSINQWDTDGCNTLLFPGTKEGIRDIESITTLDLIIPSCTRFIILLRNIYLCGGKGKGRMKNDLWNDKCLLNDDKISIEEDGHRLRYLNKVEMKAG